MIFVQCYYGCWILIQFITCVDVGKKSSASLVFVIVHQKPMLYKLNFIYWMGKGKCQNELDIMSMNQCPKPHL